MERRENSPAPPASTARTTLDRTRILPRLVPVYAFLYLGWVASGWGASSVRDIAAHLAFLPLNLAVLFLTWRVTRRKDVNDGTRRAMRLIGAAFGAVLLGNALSFWLGMIAGQNPLIAWTNAVYFLFYLLALAGLLSLPLTRRVENELWKLLLDAATVVVGSGIAIWYLVVRPTTTVDLHGFGATAIAIAYPVLSLVLLLGVITVLLRKPLPTHPLGARLLIGAFLLYLISDLANDVLVLRIGWRGIAWTDVTFMLSYCILAYALASYDRPPLPVSSDDTANAAAQPFSLLPYLAVAMAYGLMAVIAVRQWPEPLGVLALGAVCVTALVIIRQMAAVRENARLVVEQAAREREARFKALVQHSSDVIIVVDEDSVIRFVSPTITRIFGYTPADLEGCKLGELVHKDDMPHAFSFFLSVAPLGAVTAPYEWRVRHRDGSWRDVEAVGTNLLGEPTVNGIVINTRDITERKALQAQLTHQAFHDQLTGLANRALFLDRVTHALTLARRHQRTVAVIFVDLDNFKTVNDSLGHAAGDGLLVVAAQRLVTAVRTADTVSRLGGDEFAVLIEEAADEAATAVAQRITDSLKNPFLIDGKEVFVSASMGIAAAREEDSGADLLRNADMAMYMAKSRGKGRFDLFEPRMHQEAMDRLELEGDLRHAFARGEFTLLYQPIVQLLTGEITGVEALVRWRHPGRGTLTPMQFIPLAEETGLIVPLGRWVVREACKAAKSWQLARDGGTPLSLTINISGHQLKGESVVDDVRGALEDSGLAPHHLVLEITESVLMQHSDTLLERLHALKALGVRLAIDDFGTGYSSLGYLQRFPIDILKIDKTFVDDVGRGGTEPALAQAVIALGETLKLQTIAEGIEQQHQLSGLQELGCEMGQGFYFARPITPEAIETILAGGPPGVETPYSELVKRVAGMPAV